MRTISSPPRKLAKEYTNAYPRLLPASKTPRINEKFLWLYSIKYKNTAGRSIYPFSFSRVKDYNLTRRLSNITFESVTAKDLQTTYQYLGLWFLCGGPNFLLFPLFSTSDQLGGIIILLIFIAFISLSVAIKTLKTLLPYAFAITKNRKNIKLLIDGIGTAATFIGSDEVSGGSHSDSLFHRVQFSYFTDDGTHQTISLPSRALSDIDQLAPGDQKLLLYLPKEPSKGVLYDLIPFAPNIHYDTGELISPSTEHFAENKKSIIWMILYGIAFIPIIPFMIMSVYAFFSFLLLAIRIAFA